MTPDDKTTRAIEQKVSAGRLMICYDPRKFLQMKLESEPNDEAIEVHGRADHWRFAGAGGWRFDRGGVPQSPDQQRHVLRLKGGSLVAWTRRGPSG
jgi:hypothetical protein